MNLNSLFVALRGAALALVTSTAMAAWALEVGTGAPDLNLPGLKNAVNLAEMKGKVVYVDFWASWCGPCKKSFPFMNELQAKYGAEGFEVLAVNVDAKRADADKFLEANPVKFTVAFDAKGDSAKRYQVKGMPSSYLIGRDGKIVATHKGFKDEDRKDMEALIARAVGTK